jgi:hypothetical protein
MRRGLPWRRGMQTAFPQSHDEPTSAPPPVRRAATALFLVVVLFPVASAKAPGPSFAEEAAPLVREMAERDRDARIATVEHAMGALSSREAAHALRRHAERFEVLSLEIAGMEPPARFARAHGSLAAAVDAYARGLREMESCYRGGPEHLCSSGAQLLERAGVYRGAAAERLGVRSFS